MFTIRLRQSNIHLISPKFRQVIDASTALEELERDSTLADLLKEAEQKKEELIKFLNE